MHFSSLWLQCMKLVQPWKIRTATFPFSIVTCKHRNPSPEVYCFGAFLMPHSHRIGWCRVKCQDRVGWRNLAAVIQVRVNIRGCPDVTVTEPFLNLLQTDAIRIKQTGATMAEIVKAYIFWNSPLFESPVRKCSKLYWWSLSVEKLVQRTNFAEQAPI